MQGYRSREAANHHGRELHRKVGTSSEAVDTKQLSVSFMASSVVTSQVLEVMASSSRLEHKLNQCLWAQEVLMVLVAALMAVCSFTLYMYFSFGCTHWITAEN